MEDIENIPDLPKGWLDKALSKIKRNGVAVSFLTVTGGLGTWMGYIQNTLNNIDKIPQTIERVEKLEDGFSTMHGIMKVDTNIFNITFRKMKGLIDTLPLLYYKANIIERDFVRVKKRQDEVIEKQHTTEDELFDMRSNIRSIDRRTRTEHSISAHF